MMSFDLAYLWSFYVENFQGRLLPDEEFYRIAIEARAFVDSIVSNRENLEIKSIADKYGNAICAVAEEIYKQETDESGERKQSESVGDHSVSFAKVSISAAEREQIKHQKARMYLVGTGLLYRG